MMYMCGMYDFSGEWAFSVGVPGKSGVSGTMMIVIPGLLVIFEQSRSHLFFKGMAIWSPPLDSYGNSVRGIAFSKSLVQVNLGSIIT